METFPLFLQYLADNLETGEEKVSTLLAVRETICELEEQKRSAELGCPEAFLELAKHWDHGTEEGEKKALPWYQKAAEQGILAACIRFGVLCWRYQKTIEQVRTAYKYLLEIPEASADYAQGQYLLGQMDTYLRQQNGLSSPSAFERTHYANGAGFSEEAKAAWQRIR